MGSNFTYPVYDTSDGNMKMFCIVWMTHLCKIWVYFPNLHLQMSLSFSFSFPPSATIYFYPQTFSRPLGLCVWRILLLTNRTQVCISAPVFARVLLTAGLRVICPVKPRPSRLIDRSFSHSDHELLSLSKLIQQSLKQQSQLQQKQNRQGWTNGKRRWDLF